jgi:hypothetical protein
MAGLVPAIHVLRHVVKAWMRGTSPRMTRSEATRTFTPPQLGREVLETRGGEIDRHLRRGLAGTGTVFARTGDVGGGEPERGGGLEIVRMRGDHHAVGGREIERLRCRQIDARLRLEVPGDLGPEDRVPWQLVAAGDVDHQRDVAVRHRREAKPRLEPRQARRHVGPAVEPVPGEIELSRGLLGQRLDSEARQDALEVLSMQHVELGKGRAPRPHLLHGGLIFAAPGVSEGEPVDVMAERRQDRLRLARNRAAPVRQRAEHVEEQGLGRHVTDP